MVALAGLFKTSAVKRERLNAIAASAGQAEFGGRARTPIAANIARLPPPRAPGVTISGEHVQDPDPNPAVDRRADRRRWQGHASRRVTGQGISEPSHLSLCHFDAVTSAYVGDRSVTAPSAVATF
jgi:hypothetical protein